MFGMFDSLLGPPPFIFMDDDGYMVSVKRSSYTRVKSHESLTGFEIHTEDGLFVIVEELKSEDPYFKDFDLLKSIRDGLRAIHEAREKGAHFKPDMNGVMDKETYKKWMEFSVDYRKENPKST